MTVLCMHMFNCKWMYALCVQYSYACVCICENTWQLHWSVYVGVSMDVCECLCFLFNISLISSIVYQLCIYTCCFLHVLIRGSNQQPLKTTAWLLKHKYCSCWYHRLYKDKLERLISCCSRHVVFKALAYCVCLRHPHLQCKPLVRSTLHLPNTTPDTAWSVISTWSQKCEHRTRKTIHTFCFVWLSVTIPAICTLLYWCEITAKVLIKCDSHCYGWWINN